MLDTIIFDLDGTLLDTLDDLANSVNYALRTHRLKERSIKDIRRFLGNGIRYLMTNAVDNAVTGDDFETVFQTFRTHYVAHCLDTTRPYPGIMQLLETLKSKQIKMAIVSNKLDPAVQELAERFFKDTLTPPWAKAKPCAASPTPTPCLKPCTI